MARKHRMTAARRAALRKAQLASARKRRRRQRLQGAGLAVGSVALVFGTKRLNKYADNPRLIGRDYRDLKNAAKNAKKGYRHRKENRKIRRGMKKSGNSFQYGPWV